MLNIFQDRGFCHNENFELHAVQYNTEITRVPVGVPHVLTQLHERAISLDISPWLAGDCYLP